MADNILEKYKSLLNSNLSDDIREIINSELIISSSHPVKFIPGDNKFPGGIYNLRDFDIFPGFAKIARTYITSLKTLDELIEKDKRREKDGFPRRIRIGKIVKPSKDNNQQIVIVPTTTEPKFYHDDSTTDEDSTGGTGEGEEGYVIGETPAQPQQGEGEGQGAGSGNESGHDISSDAFDLGKVLTEKFKLPNLKEKGKKRSFTKFKYDLTDKNRGFGQFLDKKATLKRIIQTNILLGNINPADDLDSEALLINPQDNIYRIMSKEKDFESQAVVFFVRDYSGSMQGAPTDAIAAQHLFIYSWLMYQYKNNVMSRFILHDNSAKEVPDFYTYHNSAVSGGTSVYPAYDLVNKIVEDERLAIENNIYIFHGTDGDDWDTGGEKALAALRKMLTYSNRIGISIAQNSWSGGAGTTTVENYLDNSKLLREKPSLIRLDSFQSEGVTEDRIIDGIKKLIS